MTIAFICILIACFLPIVCAGISKKGTFHRGTGGFDNNNPREWIAQQEGYRKRAQAAQENSWEALPLFISGVLISHYLRAPQLWLDLLAVLFIALRCGFIWAYVTDRASVRSGIWMAGVATCVAIFFLSLVR